MLLLIVLLVPSSAGWLHANQSTEMEYDCMNDFLFTVNCTVNISTSENSSRSYWLSVNETVEKEKKFVCKMMKTESNYSCSFDTKKHLTTFTELDTYAISLCYNQNSESPICGLNDTYIPKENIKPNAPCCLKVSHDSSKCSFSWKSTYEENSGSTALTENLQYQILCYSTSDNEMFPPMITYSTEFFVDDEKFCPDTDYAAKVRTTPNQDSFKGQWSDWSSEVHWRAPNKGLLTKVHCCKNFVCELGKKVLVPESAIVILGLLFCIAPARKLYIRWRQRVIIPTPAPYFDFLYNECHGDFKSWVVTQENTADILEPEETLQIDTVTKYADNDLKEDSPPLVTQQLMEGSANYNMEAKANEPAIPGAPYAITTMAPEPELYGHHEGASADLSCWHCRDMCMENVPFRYCNEYCTLSAFQSKAQPTGSG